MATHTDPADSSTVADFMASAPWPHFAEDEVFAAADVLKSGKVNYWTGQEGKRFEAEFAQAVGSQYGIAFSNGTVSLEAAYRALGLGSGDDFVTTPRTFVATSLAGTILGARPIFADVERDGGNITAESIDAVLTPKTRLISIVHLGGWPAEMNEIRSLADSRGIAVVEDCAQAHGAKLNGRSVGAWSEVASWSFCQDKIMTTGGEGGMLTTNDQGLADWCWSFKDHGKNRDKVSAPHDHSGYRWLHDGLGTNARMTEVQAAIGRIQLRKLPNWIERRKGNAQILIDRLQGLSLLRIPVPPAHSESAWYKFYAYVQLEALADGWSRDRIVAEVTRRGIPAFSGSCSEIYREESLVSFAPGEPLPVARELGETSMMLLVHPTLTEAHMHRIADVVAEVVRKAAR